MEKDAYDLAIEGTTLKDIDLCDSSRRIVVLDKSGNYGTTYSKIESLRDCPYIKNLEITKNTESFDGIKVRLSIEALPFLLSYGDHAVESFRKKIMGDEIEYVNISDIFYISGGLSRVPTSKNDILRMDLSDDDRFYLFRAIKSASLSILRSNFKDKSHPIYQALAVHEVFCQRDLERLSRNIGSSIFIYPVHGMSEISESVSMLNSFKGTTYVLNRTLKRIDTSPTDEYKHVFSCDLGTLYIKELKQQKLEIKEHFVRVVLTQKQKFHGNFLAFLAPNRKDCVMDIPDRKDCDLDTSARLNCKDKFIKVIGLNSSAEVCNEGLQLLYFIKEHRRIEDREVQQLQIFEKDILVDLSFKTVYDIDQFS